MAFASLSRLSKLCELCLGKILLSKRAMKGNTWEREPLLVISQGAYLIPKSPQTMHYSSVSQRIFIAVEKMKILSKFCRQVLCNQRHRIASSEPTAIEVRSLSVNAQVCIKFNTGTMVKQKQTRTIGLNPFCAFHINVENIALTLTQRNASNRCKWTFMHVLQYLLVSLNLCWLFFLFQFRLLSPCYL